MDSGKTNETVHIPVLLREALEGLALKPGDVVLDATAGGGGHARALCDAVGARGRVIALDRDPDAVARATSRLQGAPCSFVVREAQFSECAHILKEEGITSIGGALFDLGFSSDQLEASGRGFSLRRGEEPLDMRFNPAEQSITAADLLHTLNEEDLARILFVYGEERFARRIARTVVEAREEAPFDSVSRLVFAVEQAIPKRFQHGRLHPATKTFQALRIAVNDEVTELRAGIESAFAALSSGGRLAVISFHGLEDRFVKLFFREQANAGSGVLITKKPIIPTEVEREKNTRARSGKLRIIEKR